MELIEGYEEGAYCDFMGAYAKVYTISDPAGVVFYVGVTTRKMEDRIAGHISQCKNGYGSDRKIKLFKKYDYNVTFAIVEMFWVAGRSPLDMLNRARPIEKGWIKKYRELGYDLVNGKPRTITKRYKPEAVGTTYEVKNLK